MDDELWFDLLYGFVFYGILYSLPFLIVEILKQRCIRALCKYKGAKEKPGRACVICAYHHHCARASRSKEYKWYSYCRRVFPHPAKEQFDEIWAEEIAKSQRSA